MSGVILIENLIVLIYGFGLMHWEYGNFILAYGIETIQLSIFAFIPAFMPEEITRYFNSKWAQLRQALDSQYFSGLIRFRKSTFVLFFRNYMGIIFGSIIVLLCIFGFGAAIIWAFNGYYINLRMKVAPFSDTNLGFIFLILVFSIVPFTQNLFPKELREKEKSAESKTFDGFTRFMARFIVFFMGLGIIQILIFILGLPKPFFGFIAFLILKIGLAIALLRL